MSHSEYVYKGNRILVVLQGYPMDFLQLESYVEKLRRVGLQQIVVSSYSEFIREDNLLASYVKLDKKIINSPFYPDGPSSQFGDIKPKGLGIYYPGYINMDIHRPNINFQIHSTLEGIKEGYRVGYDFEYILKCRIDYELGPNFYWIDKAISRLDPITPNTQGIYNKKIVGVEVDKWRLDDFVYFGAKEDIFRMFNIPFKQTMMEPQTYLTSTYPKSQGYNNSWKSFKSAHFIDAGKIGGIEGVWKKKEKYKRIVL